MAVLALLHDLAKNKVKIWLDGEQLRFQAPKGALTAQLRKRLKEAKQEVIAHLKKNLSVRQAQQTIAKADRSQRLKLSFAQQRLWFFEQNEPGTSTYNISFCKLVKGPLVVEALQQAMVKLVERHESLRTCFDSENGEPFQVVKPSITLEKTFADFSLLDTDLRIEQSKEWVSKCASEPFDLETGPLVRMALGKLADDEHLWVMVIHHIIGDGWSLEVMLSEWAEMYRSLVTGETLAMQELPIQFADYAMWERKHLDDEEMRRQLRYWETQLKAPRTHALLAVDKPRPEKMSYQGATHVFPIDSAAFRSLRKFRENDGASPFMTFLAVYYVLLYRYSGQKDWLVGTPLAKRDKEELEKLIGFLVNTIVLRCTISGDMSFEALHREVQKVCVEAFAHADVPFDKLVEALRPERDPSRNPLIQAMFSMQEIKDESSLLEGLSIEPFEYHLKVAHFDLVLGLVFHGDEMAGFIEYNSDIFTEEAVASLGKGYQTLVCKIAEQPLQTLDHYNLEDAINVQQMPKGWLQPQQSEASGCFSSNLKNAWEKNSNAFFMAIGEDLSITYEKIVQASKNLAAGLHVRGVKPGECIGWVAQTSVLAPAVLLAAEELGVDLVPIAPHLATKTVLDQLLENQALSIILAEPQANGELPDHELIADLGALLEQEASEARAFESSTSHLILLQCDTFGKQKLIKLDPMFLVANAELFQAAQISKENAAAISLPLYHPAGLMALGSMLLNGISVELLGDPIFMDGFVDATAPLGIFSIEQLPEEEGAGQLVMATFKQCLILGGPYQLPDMRRHQQQWQKDKVTYALHHSELGGWLGFSATPSNHQVAPAALRFKRAHTRALGVYSHVGSAQPQNVWGTGIWEFEGHGDKPHDAAKATVGTNNGNANNLRGLIHSSGDPYLSWQGPRMVYLRGFEVVFEQMVALLKKRVEVEDAGFYHFATPDGEPQLEAWIQPVKGEEPSSAVLKLLLRQHVDPACLPDAWHFCEKLWLDDMGNVDRVKSAERSRNEEEDAENLDPQTPQQWVMAMIWAEVLGVSTIKRDDHFFLLGGHSLMAVRVLAKVGELFKKSVTIRTLFEHPTLQDFTLQLETA